MSQTTNLSQNSSLEPDLTNPSTPLMEDSTLNPPMKASPPRRRGRKPKSPIPDGSIVPYLEVAGASAQAQRARKKIGEALMATGVPESQLPEMFVNREIARSRKSKVGQIVVHSLTGVHKNAAARTAQRFENELTEGRNDIIEKLEAAGTISAPVERLKDLMVANPRWSFSRACAEAKADLGIAIDAYARGAIALNKLNTVVAMYKELPNLLRDLMRHAIDQEETCATCFGVGLVKGRPDAKKLTLKCPSCRGSGQNKVASAHKQFAMQKALELARVLPEKQPLVAVQQNTNINTFGGEGLLEKMSKTADEILYGRKSSVIDAEAVRVTDEGGE